MKKNLIRNALVVALLLLIPLALTIRDGNVPNVGWNWSPSDFVFAFVVLFGASLVYELIAKKAKTTVYRLATIIAVLTGLALVWINAAVGIIGDSENPSHPMYLGVILIALIGVAISRLEPRGLMRAAFTTAFAQALVPVIMLVVWSPQTHFWGEPGVFGVFLLNTFFVTLWIVSGLLFRYESLKHRELVQQLG